MKRFIFPFIAVSILISCGNPQVSDQTDGERDGQEQAMEIATLQLESFDTEAGKYVDKEVRIQGIVDHVCKHGGKKLFVVNDFGDVHVTSEDRFDDALVGEEVIVKGIVREFRVDEAYCLKMEEDNIQSHSEGKTDEDQFKAKMEHLQEYRDEMATNNVDHLSFYSLEFLALEKIDTEEAI
jgi:hypothetical protein